MSETSSRLLELLSLLQGRRDWPGAELAERLEVSGRTIRRDVERLRGLGYPVESLTGPAGGYRLRAGTAMPPLLLDDDEAIAIAVGLRTAARASVTGIEETSVRALVKLEQVLPAHLRRRVSALGSATIAPPAGGPTVDPQHLTVIAAACRDSECLRFAYRSRDGTEAVARSSRTRSSTSAAAGTWSPGIAAARTGARFRVDRLSRPASTGVGSKARSAAREGRGRLRRARASRARRTATRRGSRCTHRRRDRCAASRPTGERSSRSTSGRCEYRTGDDDLGWLAMRIAMLGVEFDGSRAAGADRAPPGAGATPAPRRRPRRLSRV